MKRFLNLSELKKKFGEEWRKALIDKYGGSATLTGMGAIYVSYLDIYMGHIVYYNNENSSLAQALNSGIISTDVDQAYIDNLKKLTEFRDSLKDMSITNDYYVNLDKVTGEIFGLIHNPTGNCQLGSIVYFNTLLQEAKNRGYDADMMSIVIGRFANKKCYLFDIHQKLLERVVNLDLLTPPTPYISTNQSKMATGILVVHNYLPSLIPSLNK